MTCQQAAEQELLAKKDKERELKRKLVSSSRGSLIPSHSDSGDEPILAPPGGSPTLVSCEPVGCRRHGKAHLLISTQGKTPRSIFKIGCQPCKEPHIGTVGQTRRP